MILLEVIKNTIMISSLVMVIMMIIELINIRSSGSWARSIEDSNFLQYIICAFLGVIPGCIGTFAVVSMYLHGFVRFGALISALIAAFGDEAFVLFAMMPLTTLKLAAILIVIGIVVGIFVDRLGGKKISVEKNKKHFDLHSHESDKQFLDWKQILPRLKNITFPRFILICSGLIVILGIVSGEFNIELSKSIWYQNWEQLLFLFITAIGMYIVLTVSDHFLEEHLWQHVIKKHLFRIVLWTFGALLLIKILNQYIDISHWAHANPLTILVLAVLIGIIPESGPHLVFVSLFAQGFIPFSVLLASSIVQDGHGALPLLAESKKSFFLAKAINVIVGLIAGFAGYFFGF